MSRVWCSLGPVMCELPLLLSPAVSPVSVGWFWVVSAFPVLGASLLQQVLGVGLVIIQNMK